MLRRFQRRQVTDLDPPQMLTDRVLLKSDFGRQLDHRRWARLTAQLLIE